MDRAIELAKASGFGMVSLRNTNHWMRGGTYGLQAAAEDCIGICFTNTTPNMPPWGSMESRIGNNPLIISIPNPPEHFLLDMAMSQFSFGKMEIYSQEGLKMPYPAGYDENGNLTDDPDTVLKTELALQAGYWKGSGLSIMLDLVTSLLSEGLTSTEIGRFEDETGLSQSFIAVNLSSLTEDTEKNRIIQAVIGSLTQGMPATSNQSVFYPGQQTFQRRMENLDKGVPVQVSLWRKIEALRTDR